MRVRVEKSRIVVWFSCGAPSAVAAKLTLEKYPDAKVRIVNTPVHEEDGDNRRFMSDVARWLGKEIELAVNPKWASGSAAEVWAKERFMSGPGGASCTRAIKKEARYAWEKVNRVDFHVLGFAADEKGRHDRFVQQERDNVLPVLIEAGMSKQDCADLLTKAGIELPRIYKWGYPNANCLGCVKVTSPTYWNHVRKTHPWVFAQRAEQSREIGCRLVELKGERIFLDELPPDAVGRPLKSLKFDCGIFCDMEETA